MRRWSAISHFLANALRPTGCRLCLTTFSTILPGKFHNDCTNSFSLFPCLLSFELAFHLHFGVSVLVSFRFDSTRFALIVLLPSGGEFTQFRETVNNLAPEEGGELVELIKCFTYFTSTTTRKTFRCGLYVNFCFIFLLPLNQFRTPSIVTPNRRLSFRFLAKNIIWNSPSF